MMVQTSLALLFILELIMILFLLNSMHIVITSMEFLLFLPLHAMNIQVLGKIKNGKEPIKHT